MLSPRYNVLSSNQSVCDWSTLLTLELYISTISTQIIQLIYHPITSSNLSSRWSSETFSIHVNLFLARDLDHGSLIVFIIINIALESIIGQLRAFSGFNATGIRSILVPSFVVNALLSIQFIHDHFRWVFSTFPCDLISLIENWLLSLHFKNKYYNPLNKTFIYRLFFIQINHLLQFNSNS